ncbi:hypothetical protein Droror1_Dr00000523 [Drosera rotundifolia]
MWCSGLVRRRREELWCSWGLHRRPGRFLLLNWYVAAVDINMGCPRSCSVSGGMGAALLSKPELIHDILTTLKRNLDISVTCKIRLLKNPDNSVELARRIEKTGVSALAVHGRRVVDRPRVPAKWNEIADVVAALSIPVIANGYVFCYEDLEPIKLATGAGIEAIKQLLVPVYWFAITSACPVIRDQAIEEHPAGRVRLSGGQHVYGTFEPPVREELALRLDLELARSDGMTQPRLELFQGWVTLVDDQTLEAIHTRRRHHAPYLPAVAVVITLDVAVAAWGSGRLQEDEGVW